MLKSREDRWSITSINNERPLITTSESPPSSIVGVISSILPLINVFSRVAVELSFGDVDVSATSLRTAYLVRLEGCAKTKFEFPVNSLSITSITV